MSTNIERNLKKLLRGKKACTPGAFLKVPHWPYGTLKSSKGEMLGQGEYGKVYRGSINDDGRRYVAYKEIDTKKNALGSAAFEYKVAKRLKSYGVPDMYLYKKCDGVDILYLELVKGKEFDDWWNTSPSLEAIKSVMLQVLYNLYRIKQEIPGFRHHDLHGGNILIRPVPTKDIVIRLGGNQSYKISNGGVEAVMIDFGLSIFPRITNPLVSSGGYEYVGISKKSNPLYDLHTLLNTVWIKVTRPNNVNERKIHEFIKSVIPTKYLGVVVMKKQTILRRIGPDEGKGDIQGFKKVLGDPFFTGEKKERRVMTFLKTLTKPKKRTIITKTPAPNTGVGKDVYARAVAASLPNTGGGKDAYARAVAALKKGQVKKGPIKRPAPQKAWAMTESMVRNLRKLNLSS
jgi:serine/threonine protein kinase